MPCSPLIRSGLIASAALIFLFLHPAVNAAGAPNGPTIVVHYNATVKPVEPEKPLVTLRTTVWTTPQGSRVEESDGSVTVAVKGQTFVYELHPATKQAVRKKPVEGESDTFDVTSFNKLDRSDRSHIKGMTKKDRRTVFLGLPCVATQWVIRLKKGVQMQGEDYVTQIAGRPVVLVKTFQTSMGGFARVEATKVEVLAQAPPGLLDIPAGYQVTTEKSEVSNAAP